MFYNRYIIGMHAKYNRYLHRTGKLRKKRGNIRTFKKYATFVR